MNLNFLSPIYLLGLAGIAIPILIHLLTKRQQKRIPFSAVYLLLQSQKRSIKRAAPNRLLLLLIRCLGIALLSLALAKPIFSFSSEESSLSATPSTNVFILDDSYSMAAKAKETSVHHHAVLALLNLMDTLPKGSTSHVVLASSPPRLLDKEASDPQAMEKILSASSPSFQTTNIGAALTLALKQIQATPQKQGRIFILTDMDKNGWNENDFPESAHPVTVPIRIIDFSQERNGENQAAIQKVEVSQEFLTNSRVIRVKATLLNLSKDKQLNRLPVSLWVDGKKRSESFVDAAPMTEVEKEFSFPYQGAESIVGQVEIAGDNLETDNRRFFTYQPDQNIRVLVVDGDPKTVAHESESFYLEHALNPFTVALSNLEPTVSTLAELAMRDLMDFSVVQLCNVRDLPPGYELELEKFVMRGGALFITLGDQADPKYYNEKLGNLLPVTIESLHQTHPAKEPFLLDIKKAQHPVMKVFKAKELQEMAGIRFHGIYSVKKRDGRKMKISLQFLNGFPALIESEVGKGKVILYTSTIDRDWNDFPIQPTFLPWVQRWVKYSARSLENILRQDLLVGAHFSWKDDLRKIYVRSPGGAYHIPLTKNGESLFEDTFLPGVYRIYRAPSAPLLKAELPPSRPLLKLPTGAQPAGGFTINVDTRESVSEKIEEEELRRLIPGLPLQFVSSSESMDGIRPPEGLHLTTPFLLLMAAMLLFEGWMVRRE
jgi:hypothetical protein